VQLGHARPSSGLRRSVVTPAPSVGAHRVREAGVVAAARHGRAGRLRRSCFRRRRRFLPPPLDAAAQGARPTLCCWRRWWRRLLLVWPLAAGAVVGLSAAAPAAGKACRQRAVARQEDGVGTPRRAVCVTSHADSHMLTLHGPSAAQAEQPAKRFRCRKEHTAACVGAAHL
jgi:hypothetical protein